MIPSRPLWERLALALLFLSILALACAGLQSTL